MKEKHSNSIMRASEDNFCTRENRKCCLKLHFHFLLIVIVSAHFSLHLAVISIRCEWKWWWLLIAEHYRISSLEIYFHNQLIKWIYLFKTSGEYCGMFFFVERGLCQIISREIKFLGRYCFLNYAIRLLTNIDHKSINYFLLALS